MAEEKIKPKVGVGVGVMVVKEGKILLGKRHWDPEKADSELHGGNTWTMPGGKVEFQEELEETACREALEETGIVLNKKSLKIVSISNDKIPEAHFVTIGFYCDQVEGEPKVMEPDEIVEWQWFDLGNLPSPIFFPSQRVLENFQKGQLKFN